MTQIRQSRHSNNILLQFWCFWRSSLWSRGAAQWVPMSVIHFVLIVEPTPGAIKGYRYTLFVSWLKPENSHFSGPPHPALSLKITTAMWLKVSLATELVWWEVPKTIGIGDRWFQQQEELWFVVIHITIITKFKGKVASTPPSSQTQHVGWTSDSVPPSGLSKKTNTNKNTEDKSTKTQINYERPSMWVGHKSQSRHQACKKKRHTMPKTKPYIVSKTKTYTMPKTKINHEWKTQNVTWGFDIGLSFSFFSFRSHHWEN